jgi:hypothetical protein
LVNYLTTHPTSILGRTLKVMYYFTDWEKTERGYRPVLPENMGFLLLAQPQERTYGLFKVELSEKEAMTCQLEEVSDELEDLLTSAEHYPPALALARDKVRRVEGKTCAEFGEILAATLREYLSIQPESPFFLAEAKQTQAGFRYAGAYYWIVGYFPEDIGREILWVSRDFFIYQASLADFACDQAFLKSRFF